MTRRTRSVDPRIRRSDIGKLPTGGAGPTHRVSAPPAAGSPERRGAAAADSAKISGGGIQGMMDRQDIGHGPATRAATKTLLPAIGSSSERSAVEISAPPHVCGFTDLKLPLLPLLRV